MSLDQWRAALRRQARPTIALASPVAVAELSWMAMSTVDTLMVGRLSAEAIGAVGIGGIAFWVVLVFGMGLLLGMDALVSQAFGAGDVDACREWLIHGVALALLSGVLLTMLVQAGGAFLRAWGIHPDVLRLAEPYLAVVGWSLLPLVLFQAMRRYLLATGRPLPVMTTLLAANVVNVGANWLLVFGNLGAPALGVQGAAWAACTTRTFMALALLAYVFREEGPALWARLTSSASLSGARLRQLLELGFPAGGQLALEVAVIATMTALAGRLDPVSLAAHQVALTTASLSFMTVLGVSAAGAVRVGQALGRRDPRGAAEAGWAAFGVGGAVMGLAGTLFLLVPSVILSAFTTDEPTILLGASLLTIAAAFQLFDGVQAVAIGVLRGAGDTRTAMLATLAVHWFLGLPVGAALCFGAGWGVRGLWVGLALALVTIAAVLVVAWFRRVRLFARAYGAMALPAAG